MKPLSIKTIAFGLIFCINAFAFSEEPTAQLERTQAQQREVKAELSKDFYREEPYQSEYTVDIPYDVEETYTEDVPYQTEESYTDYEDYYENDYTCHTVTRYENQCHNEQLCHNVETPPVCRPYRECEMVGNPPHEVCKEGTRCQGGGTHQECRSENVCRQVPREYQDCGYEQVLKRREVTRYRTVTRYRQETRTRTVTKYREETRCCVTRYRDVFDHQAKLQVVLSFPPSASLLPLEKEIFQVTMTSENDIELLIQSSIFGYEIENKVQNGDTLQFFLKTVPKYSEIDLGTNSIQKLTLNILNNGSQIQFQDLGVKPRVSSEYAFRILEKDSQKIIQEGQIPFTNKNLVQMNLPTVLSYDLDYVLQLHVKRSGVVLGSVIEFSNEAVLEKSPLNQGEYTNPNSVSGFTFQGDSDATQLHFEDNSPENPLVKTTYEFKVERKAGLFGGSWKTMIENKTLAKPHSNRVSFSLAQDLGISSKDLNRYATPGSYLKITLKVIRISPRLNHGQPVQILKEETLQIPGGGFPQ